MRRVRPIGGDDGRARRGRGGSRARTHPGLVSISISAAAAAAATAAAIVPAPARRGPFLSFLSLIVTQLHARSRSHLAGCAILARSLVLVVAAAEFVRRRRRSAVQVPLLLPRELGEHALFFSLTQTIFLFFRLSLIVLFRVPRELRPCRLLVFGILVIFLYATPL